MADNDRKEGEPVPAPGLGRNQNTSGDSQKENTSGNESSNDNPQNGNKWDHYKTSDQAKENEKSSSSDQSDR